MKEITGNIWNFQMDHIIAITTNGSIKADGSLVMGRGCALEAAQRFPGLPLQLGTLVKKHGNHVFAFDYGLVSFPVKHNWWEKADLSLIEKSIRELVRLTAEMNWTSVILPRPGCGCGRLEWLKEVKPIIEPYLDDRFSVITRSSVITTPQIRKAVNF